MAESNSGPRPLLGILVLVAGAAIAVSLYYAWQKNEREQVSKDINAAIQMGKSGDIQGATKALEKVVKEHPKNTDALFNYGVALAGAQKFGDAEKVFERITKIKPDDWEAVAERAALRSLAGDNDKAFELLLSIPGGKGRVLHRLKTDPTWLGLADDPRMVRVRAKHGVTNTTY